jgi:FMN phosphatase YigB (HAD superfamily)
MRPVTAGERPAALLLDFGGVLVESHDRPEGLNEVVEEVRALVADRGVEGLRGRDIAADLSEGLAAWERWKTARSRESAPRDVSHQEFWARFVAREWPEPARRIVTDAAFELCRSLGRRASVRRPKPGALELLREARGIGARIGIVSNALSGATHRDLVVEFGFGPFVDVQLYSDELGIRKPNPELLLSAARQLRAPIERCWYVGDQHDRDVLCGRRAGAGLVFLMAGDRHPLAARRRVLPDVEIGSLYELVAVIARAGEQAVPA